MQDSIDPKQLTGARRARVLAVVTLVSGVLVAGCGGSSPRPTASASSAASGSAITAGSSNTTGAGATSSGSAAAGAGGSGPLAFAKCMRANDVPKSPDPIRNVERCSPLLESTRHRPRSGRPRRNARSS